MLKGILRRISQKTLRRLSGAVIVVVAIGASEYWSWTFADVFYGRPHATYWIAADGSATSAFDYNDKNWSGLPIREVHIYGLKAEPGDMAWYDEHGAALSWRSEQTETPLLWRHVAELHSPVHPGELLRYTVWTKHIPRDAIEHDGVQWGIFQDEEGNWVFRNNPSLGDKNTITLLLPADAEVLSAEPANRAHIVRGSTPAVIFTDLHETHVVKWKLSPK